LKNDSPILDQSFFRVVLLRLERPFVTSSDGSPLRTASNEIVDVAPLFAPTCFAHEVRRGESGPSPTFVFGPYGFPRASRRAPEAAHVRQWRLFVANRLHGRSRGASTVGPAEKIVRRHVRNRSARSAPVSSMPILPFSRPLFASLDVAANYSSRGFGFAVSCHPVHASRGASSYFCGSSRSRCPGQIAESIPSFQAISFFSFPSQRRGGAVLLALARTCRSSCVFDLREPRARAPGVVVGRGGDRRRDSSGDRGLAA